MQENASAEAKLLKPKTEGSKEVKNQQKALIKKEDLINSRVTTQPIHTEASDYAESRELYAEHQALKEKYRKLEEVLTMVNELLISLVCH